MCEPFVRFELDLGSKVFQCAISAREMLAHEPTPIPRVLVTGPSITLRRRIRASNVDANT